MESDFCERLARGMEPGANLAECLGDTVPNGDSDARAVAQALRQLLRDGEPGTGPAGRLQTLVGLFQAALEDQDTAQALREHALPELLHVYDQLLAALDDEDANFDTASELLFALKILALYATEEGTRRVVEAVTSPLGESYLWAVIFDAFTNDHPHVGLLISGLRRRLPDGFRAVAFLDACNALWLDGRPEAHPFDNPTGTERLRCWLRNADPDEFSYAVSATAALPFISEPARSPLLSMAMDHLEPTVQLEAAWASARSGSEAGIKILSRFAEDVRFASVAVHYMEELGLDYRVPAAAREPEFVAMAEMIRWLAHPMEFGQPPDTIEIYDSRQLYWPPTDDYRDVWLFRYEYRSQDSPDDPDVGLGMVGSVTFALFGEATADLSPEDAYALHCCWELQNNSDQRAPAERSIEAGRRLLQERNDGFDSR